MIKYNILDQSPVSEGMTPEEAINNTVELAQLADSLGYYRFWVSEHHNTKSFASASPEIFIPRLASVTEKIRVGSGGVLLGHYSPYKIAEQFRLLEALFPGRIDLGIGRASGADSKAVSALGTSREDMENSFAKTSELIAYLRAPEKSPHNSVTAVPATGGMPEVWTLGTSPESALYAAKNGLPYAFGSFINDEMCIEVLQTYYQNFRPSELLKEPHIILAVFAICADTKEEAEKLSESSRLWLIRTFLHRENTVFPSYETASKYSYSPEEIMLYTMRRRAALIGDVKGVAEELKVLAKKLAVHEITVVTITHEHKDRLKSYSLLANELNL